jgi:hypothetical protein
MIVCVTRSVRGVALPHLGRTGRTAGTTRTAAMIASAGSRNPVNADLGGNARRRRLESFTAQACLDLAHGQCNSASRSVRAAVCGPRIADHDAALPLHRPAVHGRRRSGAECHLTAGPVPKWSQLLRPLQQRPPAPRHRPQHTDHLDPTTVGQYRSTLTGQAGGRARRAHPRIAPPRARHHSHPPHPRGCTHHVCEPAVDIVATDVTHLT